MRKTIVTALIVLLAMLAFASCDGIIGQDGDGLVTLNVNTGEIGGNSRSLTDGLAHDEANYMEVVFVSGSGATAKYYRAEGFYGTKLKVKVPAGHYDDTNAIILIGRKSDKALLATGVPSAAIDVPDDLEITFDVISLEADISTSGNDFVIVESSGLDLSDTDGTNTKPINGVSLWTTAGTTKNGLFADGDATTPCFQVPLEIKDIEASLTITGFNDYYSIPGDTSSPVITGTGDHIFVADTPDILFIKNIESSPAIDAGGIGPAYNSTTLVAIGKTGVINFKFTTSATKGRYIITVDFPVVGFSKANSAITNSVPITWHVLGGTEPGQPDFTGDPNVPVTGLPHGNPKEGIALIVTDDPETAYSLIVKP